MFKNYDRWTFLYDLKAGITIGVVLVPQSIAYASLANVPPISALVSAIFPLFIYAVLGGSRQLSVGPEALSSVLVGVNVIETLLEPDYANLTATQIANTICLMCGIFALCLGVLRLGFIDNLLNGFLLVGFVTGIACLVMIEQLPGLLALPKRPAGNLSSLDKLIESCRQFPSAKWQPSLLGVLVVIFLLVMPEIRKRYKSRILQNLPDIFILVALSILLSWAINFESHGIPVIGTLQSTLPAPGVPVIDGALFSKLLQPCIIITLIGFIESISSARGFALKNDYEVAETQELIALGSANILGSFLGCYPVWGSLPRSRILATSGGKTTLATIIAALVVLVIVLALSQVFYYLPKSVIAGIVFVAAYRLIEFGEIWFTIRMQKVGEILFMVITFATTFFLAIEVGIILSLILSTLILVNRNCRPHLTILGRVARDHSVASAATLNASETENIEPALQVSAGPQLSMASYSAPSPADQYADINRNPNAHIVANLLILSVDSPIQYYNCGELKHQIAVLARTYEKISKRCLAVDCIKAQGAGKANGVEGLEAIVFDMKHCEDMDSSGVYILKKIVKTFVHHDIKIAFCRTSSTQIEMFSNSGLVDILGKDMFFETVQDAVAFLKK
ncbi:Solute carrier 26 [Gonapodya sp. JEL0774]|nr:Solute carrier 26 [Gonapodya sp. JEL0774]